MEPINLYLEKLYLYWADKDKRGPITKVLEKHRQDIWAISNQLRGNYIPSLPISIYSIKMAIVDKINKFIAEQKREIAKREV